MAIRRTTVVLEEDLYREAKRLAVEQDKSFKEIIEEAVRSFLRGASQPAARRSRSHFGLYPGRAVGDLRRETLYRSVRK